MRIDIRNARARHFARRLFCAGAMLALLIAASPGPASAQTPKNMQTNLPMPRSGPEKPRYYKGLGPSAGVAGIYQDRNDENFAYLRDPTKKRYWSDSLKHIDLSSSDDVYVTVNGEARLRFDSIANKNFGIATSRSTTGVYGFKNTRDVRALYSRLEFGMALNIQDWATIYAEIYDGQATGKNLGARLAAPQESELAFAQAYLELRQTTTPTHYGIRLGRQFLFFGNGLLISPDYGTNLPTPTYNAVKLFADTGDFRIDAFYAATIMYENGGLNARVQPGNNYWGFYASKDLAPASIAGMPADLTLEPFYIGYQSAPDPQGGTGGYYDSVFLKPKFTSAPYSAIAAPDTETRHSFGTRLYGLLGRVDYDWTGVAQLGAYRNYQVHAYSVMTDTGYTFAAPLTPRLGLRLNMATGGAAAGSHSLATYQPMQSALLYYAEDTVIAPTNIWNIQPRLSFKPLSNVTITLYDSLFWRYSVHDAVYSGLWEGAGVPQAFAASAYNQARFIGQQPAILARWQINRYLYLNAIGAYFITGPALGEAGAKNTAYFRVVGSFKF